MICAIAYSHKDCHQAIKLLSWVAFLSEQAGGSMRNDTVLLVPSQHAAQKQVHVEAQELKGYFKNLVVHIPSTEHEVGWPGAANFMFREALTYSHLKWGEPMFWLEPDAVPLHPQWWDTIKDEYSAVGKIFMGGEVMTGWRHMSGIGVYGLGSMRVAPSLVTVPDNSSWDIHAAREMIPHTHFTQLIRHVKTPQVKDLSVLDTNEVVFHQDKQLHLIKLLSGSYGAEIQKTFENIIDANNEPVMSTRYFTTPNATKLIESQGIQFAFEPVGTFAGLMKGVYAAEKESEIIALEILSKQERSPVREITAEDYAKLAKKKAPSFNSLTHFPGSPLGIKKSADVVRVENPVPQANKPEVPKVNLVSSLEEILKTDTVRPLEPTNIPQVKQRAPRHKSGRR